MDRIYELTPLKIALERTLEIIKKDKKKIKDFESKVLSECDLRFDRLMAEIGSPESTYPEIEIEAASCYKQKENHEFYELGLTDAVVSINKRQCFTFKELGMIGALYPGADSKTKRS